MREEPKLNQSSEQIPVRELDANEALDTLYWSFYYSQGETNVQANIFHYMAAKHPEWRFPELPLDAEQTKRFYSFVQSSAHRHGVEQTKNENIAREIQTEYGALKGIFRYPDAGISGPSLEESLFQILYNQLDLDDKYEMKGRPRDKEISKGYARSNLSHFATYVLGNEKPPGSPIYTEMFDDLKKFFNTPKTQERLGY